MLRSMETAPRDGRTTIILYVDDGDRVVAGRARWAPFYCAWAPEFEIRGNDPRPLGWECADGVCG